MHNVQSLPVPFSNLGSQREQKHERRFATNE
jgi:hypothetical protein